MQDSIKVEKGVLSLPIDCILYFAYQKHQETIKIITENKEYIYTDKIGSLEARMNPLGFETSCRGFLVNMAKVINVRGVRLEVSNGDVIPLSRKRVAEFKERMNEYVHDSFN